MSSPPPALAVGLPLAAWALSAPVFDAHCHFEDARIWENRATWVEQAVEAGVRGFAVKGTVPEDWGRVDEVCREWGGKRVRGCEESARTAPAGSPAGQSGECDCMVQTRFRDADDVVVCVPSYGVHPWFLAEVEAGSRADAERDRRIEGGASADREGDDKGLSSDRKSVV